VEELLPLLLLLFGADGGASSKSSSSRQVARLLLGCIEGEDATWGTLTGAGGHALVVAGSSTSGGLAKGTALKHTLK